MVKPIETLTTASKLRVVVELEVGPSQSLVFDSEVKVEDVEKSIRKTFSLTGGTLQKKKKVSNSTAKFTTVINDEEVISVDYDYKFVRGKSGIVSNSV